MLGCINDLMFSTRLRDSAKGLGHNCAMVRTAGEVSGRLDGVDVVVIDLMVRGGGALEAVGEAKAAGVMVVAYGEHVAADVLGAARDAGADEVWTRREFTRRLAGFLEG